MESPTLREAVSDAIRYWEPRRLAYNGVLVVIVLFYFFRAYPASRSALELNAILGLFLLAVLANIAYCAAYIADVFAQWSSYVGFWRRYRWVLLVTGILFAGILTRFFSIAMFFPN